MKTDTKTWFIEGLNVSFQTESEANIWLSALPPNRHADTRKVYQMNDYPSDNNPRHEKQQSVDYESYHRRNT